jgi:hypothetical protein
MIFNSEMNLLRRVKQRLLGLAGRGRDSDGARFYSQTGEDAILAHLLFGHDSGFYVDVGAFHPTKYSNTYYFYQRGWTGINIEPTPGQTDLFRKLRPRDINLAFRPRRTFRPWTVCEQIRRLAVLKDRHNVNIASTAVSGGISAETGACTNRTGLRCSSVRLFLMHRQTQLAFPRVRISR